MNVGFVITNHALGISTDNTYINVNPLAMKKRLLFIILFLSQNICISNAQVSTNTFFNHLGVEFTCQYIGITNKPDLKEQVFGGYIGYKFNEYISLGITSGRQQELERNNNTYQESYYFGLGFNKLLKSSISKDLLIELHFRVNSASEFYSENNRFLFYEAGFKIIPKEVKNIFISTGVKQNFYNYDRSPLLVWCISIGIRI